MPSPLLLTGNAVRFDRFERCARAVRGKSVVIYHSRFLRHGASHNIVFAFLCLICVLTGFAFLVDVSSPYSESTRTYPVRFLDWDGTELQENY